MSKEPNIFGLIEYSRHDIFVDATDAVREADRFYIMIEADAVLKGQEELVAEKDKEIESLKASHYTEMVDAGMRERRLKRALYKACANWAHIAVAFFSSYVTKNRWRWMELKCLKKAEEYK